MRLSSLQWIRVGLPLSLVSVFSFFVSVSSPNVDAQPESINVQNTVVTAPLTVVVPITGDVQNAQICVSAGSAGTQSCTQLIVNPEQTAYTPVSADLTQSESPTVSNAVQQEPAPAAEPITTAATAADTPSTTDSQQAPQSPTLTTAPETTTDEQPASESQSPEETSNQEEDNNSKPGDTATSEEGSASEGSSNGE
jgi:hypothetical protein